MEALSKNWNNGIASSKKFLSRVITYRLSNLLDSKAYEVVFEGRLNTFDENEPDVVVYKRGKEIKPVMAIEVCRHNDVSPMILQAKSLMESFGLADFYIYDRDNLCWTNLRHEAKGFVISSSSFFKNVSLDQTLVS
jgi:hypothetical protein